MCVPKMIKAKRSGAKKIFLLNCLLVAISFALPWFTVNARVSGYYWGINVVPYIVIPVSYMVVYAKKGMNGLVFDLLWEVSIFSIPLACLYTFYTWPIQFHITSEVSLYRSMHTSTLFFWLSLFFAYTLVIVGNFYLHEEKSKREET